MNLLYSIGIKVYGMAILIASMWNAKANLWVNGRKDWQKKIKKQLTSEKDNVWFHFASLGEYEQGAELLAKISSYFPNYTIVVSFFSPSGFEKFEPESPNIFKTYLPLDTQKNANQFMGLIKPKWIVFTKYDLWPNYIDIALKDNIPILLISAFFRPNKFYFRSYGKFMLRNLKRFSQIFVQDEESFLLLENHDFDNVQLGGDTRVDRVLKIKSENRELEDISRFKSTQRLFIGGSVWDEDEEIILSFIKQMNRSDWKVIFAPHVTSKKNIIKLSQKIEGLNLIVTLFSDPNPDADVLIIDGVGILKYIYKYADLVYVGGGFGEGAHNTLEPAVFHCPILVGPKNRGFPEISYFLSGNMAQEINTKKDFEDGFSFFSKVENYQEAKLQFEKYFLNHSGATNNVFRYIQDNFI